MLEDTNAASVPKSSGRPSTPAGMPSGSWSSCGRSVSCIPGWSELTVTPSPATSRQVLRNPVAPARAVFGEDQLRDRLPHAIDVIATTLPHRCAHVRDGRVAHRDHGQAVQLERGEVLVDSGRGGVPAEDHPRSSPGCRCRRVRRRRRRRNRAPLAVETSAVNRVVSDAVRGVRDRVRVAAAQGDVNALVGEGGRRRDPSPRLAAATAAGDPRCRGP